MRREGLGPDDIAVVVTHVHQGAINVRGAVDIPQTVHQAKFSMGAVLGLIAVHGVADRNAFERHVLADDRVARFRSKVRMELDAEVAPLYPKQWVGKVSITTVTAANSMPGSTNPRAIPVTRLRNRNWKPRLYALPNFEVAPPLTRCALHSPHLEPRSAWEQGGSICETLVRECDQGAGAQTPSEYLTMNPSQTRRFARIDGEHCLIAAWKRSGSRLRLLQATGCAPLASH
ncbi:hypothetical protein [Mesorhizobium sp. LjNodule214]|uniref:hypothetical protein n=1 Tax=Mesorhizobium sp. LjNodule214 TaxID=3342252 RepID=UPI003ECE1BE4